MHPQKTLSCLSTNYLISRRTNNRELLSFYSIPIVLYQVMGTQMCKKKKGNHLEIQKGRNSEQDTKF